MALDFSSANWQWPTGMDSPEPSHPSTATSSSSAFSSSNQYTQHTPEHPSTTSNAEPDPEPEQPRRRTYKPRTCRICLEVVNPTTEIDESLAAGLFASKTRVRFESEDPELGRLVSPCKCKGTQKYVHEGCLQLWRQAAPLTDRNYWRCPTCGFEYRLSRLNYGRWLSSTLPRVGLTLVVMLIAIFLLGFIADPIIALWMDPLGTILSDSEPALPFLDVEDEPDSWWFHFVKGLLSLGLVGFLKTFLSPYRFWTLRFGGTNRRRGRGRDRMEDVNWGLVFIGVVTFLGATWKFVSYLSAKALEKASNRVLDVQGDDEDDFESEPEADESRKDM